MRLLWHRILIVTGTGAYSGCSSSSEVRSTLNTLRRRTQSCCAIIPLRKRCYWHYSNTKTRLMRLFKPLCFSSVSIPNLTFKTWKVLLYIFCTFNMEGRLSFCISQTILFFKFDIMHVNEAVTSPSPTFPHPTLMERKMQLLGISLWPFAFALFLCEDLNAFYLFIYSFIYLHRASLVSSMETLSYIIWYSKKWHKIK